MTNQSNNNFYRHENLALKLEALQASTMSWNRTSYIKYPEFKRRATLPREQVEALVTRLNTSKASHENTDNAGQKATGKSLSQGQINDMLGRLADAGKNREKTPERQRTGAGRVMGVVNTYAWMDGRLLKSRITRPDGNWY